MLGRFFTRPRPGGKTAATDSAQTLTGNPVEPPDHTGSEAVTGVPPSLAIPVYGPDRVMATLAEQNDLLKRLDHLAYQDQEYRLFKEILAAFIEYVHLLPASLRHHHCWRGGLLFHSVDVANRALQASTGSTFTRTDSPQEKERELPAWRLAIWVTGLSHDLGKVITDLTVRSAAERSEVWVPLMEPLTAWAKRNGVDHYRVEWTENPNHQYHGVYSPWMAQRILAQHHFGFIQGGGNRVVETFLRALAGFDDSRENPILRLVQKADSDSTAHDMGKPYHQVHGQESPLRTEVREAIRKAVTEGVIAVNQAGKGAGLWTTRTYGVVLEYHDGLPALEAMYNRVAQQPLKVDIYRFLHEHAFLEEFHADQRVDKLVFQEVGSEIDIEQRVDAVRLASAVIPEEVFQYTPVFAWDPDDIQHGRYAAVTPESGGDSVASGPESETGSEPAAAPEAVPATEEPSPNAASESAESTTPDLFAADSDDDDAGPESDEGKLQDPDMVVQPGDPEPPTLEHPPSILEALATRYGGTGQVIPWADGVALGNPDALKLPGHTVSDVRRGLMEGGWVLPDPEEGGLLHAWDGQGYLVLKGHVDGQAVAAWFLGGAPAEAVAEEVAEAAEAGAEAVGTDAKAEYLDGDGDVSSSPASTSWGQSSIFDQLAEVAPLPASGPAESEGAAVADAAADPTATAADTTGGESDAGVTPEAEAVPDAEPESAEPAESEGEPAAEAEEAAEVGVEAVEAGADDELSALEAADADIGSVTTESRVHSVDTPQGFIDALVQGIQDGDPTLLQHIWLEAEGVAVRGPGIWDWYARNVDGERTWKKILGQFSSTLLQQNRQGKIRWNHHQGQRHGLLKEEWASQVRPHLSPHQSSA